MDDKLTKVKLVFDNIKEMRSEIAILFDSLNGRIKKLKEMYSEFVTYTKSIKTADVKSFIFSLDSFYFQTSLLQKEYYYLNDYYGIIVNRMYGEYYKLLKLITEFVEKSMIDNKLHEILKNKKYPKYDDLDDARQYPFEIILQLNEDIIAVVNYLIHVLKDKEMSLKQYTTNQNYGLNVNNFVSTYNYEVVVLQEQINLYEKYLEFFYHVHEKLLKRLITKISVLEAQLNTDIKFEGGLLSKKKDNKALFKDLNLSALPKSTQRDLRKSIVGNSPLNSNNSDIDIEEAFVSIENVHPVSSENTIYEHPKTIRSVLSNSDSSEEKELVAKKIFEKHNLIVDKEEHSNNLRVSRSESFELNNEFNNEFNNDETELIDIIPHEQKYDDDDIKNIIHEVVEKVKEEEEEQNESDDDKETINSQTDSNELTAKQKKNAKKRQKKKEKAQKEKEENELLDKMKEENGNYTF
jgi:hypothetical protein|uniref:Uncharacterized protein n=1 Tax=viral metagenome TaxID=1070528 RepID=A0A6C0CXY8_9ZZZZ